MANRVTQPDGRSIPSGVSEIWKQRLSEELYRQIEFAISKSAHPGSDDLDRFGPYANPALSVL